MLREVQTILLEHSPEGHADVAEAQAVLKLALVAKGDLEEAAPCQCAGAPVFESSHPVDDPLVLAVPDALAPRTGQVF